MIKILAVGVSILLLLTTPLLHAQNPSLDVTFNPGTGPNAKVYAVAEQTNGYIVIGGAFTNFNGSPQQYITRLDPFGNLDSSFYIGVGPNNPVMAVGIQTNNQIIIGGAFNAINGVYQGYGIARLRSDGSVDPSFTNSANGSVSQITMQSNGTALLVGDFYMFNGLARNGVVLLNADGTLDLSFNPASGLGGGSVNAAIIQPDGNIILAGNISSGANILERVNAAGIVDPTFNSGAITGNIYTRLDALALQTNNQILIGGSFESVNGYSRINLARLNTDGSMDTGFIPPSTMNSGLGAIISIGLQSNGQIIITGGFSTVAGNAQNSIARLNTNGSLDGTFNLNMNPQGAAVDTQFIQPNGKIVLGGSFTNVNGTNINNLVRLNADGINPSVPQFLGLQFYAGMYLTGTTTNTYRIESTASLPTQSLWTPITNLMLPSSPYLFFDLTSPGTTSRFYRMVTLQ